VAWDERLTDYHFGPGHPMAPVRVELTMRLAHEFGLWSQPGVIVAAAAHAAIHALAHDLAGGRWLLTGGGGYELVQVVPRTWTHLLAEAAGQPIDPGTQTPAPWREYVARRTGLTAPEHMTEGAPAVFKPFESGYDPGRPIDQAIMATRNAIFPLHGLTPLLPAPPDERPGTARPSVEQESLTVTCGQPAPQVRSRRSPDGKDSKPTARRASMPPARCSGSTVPGRFRGARRQCRVRGAVPDVTTRLVTSTSARAGGRLRCGWP
jgi:hypothetical protein